MKKSQEFPEKVVLAVGYPWANGLGPYFEMVMCGKAIGTGSRLELKFPKSLWKPEVPKYRLVLEKVKK